MKKLFLILLAFTPFLCKAQWNESGDGTTLSTNDKVEINSSLKTSSSITIDRVNSGGDYAAIELRANTGAFIDFTEGSNDYDGRIIWNYNDNNRFNLYGNVKMMNAFVDRTIFEGNIIKRAGGNDVFSINENGLEYHMVTGNLGSTKGDYKVLNHTNAYGQSNNFRIKEWLLRNDAGSDWLSVDHVNGIAVDVSFDTPESSRTWWRRDPQIGIHKFGNGSDTFVTIKKDNAYFNGKVYANEVKVENTYWPDYVFSNDYELTSLEETETFIKENGHLPEVPSAQQVEEEGISLGEMNAILLKKIEELTLHVIDQKKSIDNLIIQNERQEKIIQQLSSKK